MTKKIVGVCAECGKEFSYYLSSNKGKVKNHCSRACFSASRRIWTACPHCGKEFWYHRSWPRKFCSRACSTTVNAKTNLGIVELPDMFCEMCGKELTGQKWANRRFCTQRCFGDWLSKTQTGVPRPEVSGPNLRLRKRTTLVCPECGKEFEVKKSSARRRRFCSKDCMALWQSKHDTGENNRNWKGGYDPYYGPNWRQQRRNARRRDKYTCQRCGIHEDELDRQLDVHHIKPFRTFAKGEYRKANSLPNLISLCRVCHLLVENGHGY